MIGDAHTAEPEAREEQGPAPEPGTLVSVIVPTFNNADILPACLDALLAQEFPAGDFEVIVVDDGSNDDTRRLLARYEQTSRRLRTFRQPNQGPAAARNHGAGQAKGDVLMFTDDDCIPTGDWIAQMFAPFSDAEVCGVKGVYKTRQTGMVPQFAQAEFESRYRKMQKADSIDFVDTYAAAFRRQVFLELGGFDTRFPKANNEDVEFSYRMASHGHKMVFNPQAVVFHTHPETVYSYLKLKFGRAYWRMAVYRAFPEKMSSDSYTPQSLKLQIVLAFLLLVSLAAGLLQQRYVGVAVALLAVFLATTSPFLLMVLRIPALDRALARTRQYLTRGAPARVVHRVHGLIRHVRHWAVWRGAKEVLRRVWRMFARGVRAFLASAVVRRTVRSVRKLGVTVVCDVGPRVLRFVFEARHLPGRLLTMVLHALRNILRALNRLPPVQVAVRRFRGLAHTKLCLAAVSFSLLLLRALAMGFGVLWGLQDQQTHKGRFTQVLVLTVADIGGILLGSMAAYWMSAHVFHLLDTGTESFALYLRYVAVWTAFLLPVFFLAGLYKPYRGLSQVNEFVLLNKSVLAATIICILVLYLTAVPHPKLIVILVAFFTLVFVPLARWIGRTAYAAGAAGRDANARSRVLVVGTGEIARLICRRLQRTADVDTDIVGLVAEDRSAVGTTVDDHPVIGSVDELGSVIETHGIEEVFVALPILPQEDVIALVDRHSHREGVHFHIISSLFDLISAEVDIASYSNIPITYLRNEKMALLQLLLKRMFDVVVSALVVVVTLPLWVLIMIAIKLDSDGPALFRQERVGKDGKPFKIYKFRTMYSDTDKFEYSPSSPDDQRITRVGRFLRKTSLDEFPQFLNILKGDMSLVGPRPEMPFIVAGYNEWQRQRLKVKPGLTGLWQIMGRKDLPLHESLEYDFYYIKNQSLLLDLTIIIKTIPKVLMGKGAY